MSRQFSEKLNLDYQGLHNHFNVSFISSNFCQIIDCKFVDYYEFSPLVLKYALIREKMSCKQCFARDASEQLFK